MLSTKENFLETIRGGNPDRFVNGFEYMVMPFADPFVLTDGAPAWPGAPDGRDGWGILWSWPEGSPAPVSGSRCTRPTS